MTATPILLCLHGWGGTKESFAELRGALAGDPVEILAPDLPGFGTEPEPPSPWATGDYAAWVTGMLRERGLDDDVLRERGLLVLGHSHGGRIALVLAARRRLPVRHLFLCAAAGIRRPRHLKRVLGLTLAKSGSLLLRLPGMERLRPLARRLLYRLVRVHDYERASPLMRQTLIRVTAEDLRPLLPLVEAPTDIFWGESDRMTPIADGRLMHERIRGSMLHVFPGVRHRVHRERAAEIAAVIRRVLEEGA